MARTVTETTQERFWKKVRKGRKCSLWQGGRNSKGYGVFAVKTTLPRKFVYAHRFAWEQAKGPIPQGMQVNHKCDIPLCVKIAHLWLGTQLDNTLDAQQKGRRRCSAYRKHLLPKHQFTKSAGNGLLIKLGLKGRHG